MAPTQATDHAKDRFCNGLVRVNEWNGPSAPSTVATHADGLLVKRFVTQDVAGSAHGEFTLSAPGYAVISHVAGLDLTDGIHHGVFRVVEDPQVAAELCAALTA